MAKLKPILICAICAVLLSACWDQTEIEDRAFIFGMAIDVAKDSESKIKLTQQLVVPENIASATEGGVGGKAYRNLTGTGRTLYEVNREMSKEASRPLDSTHLGVVLFSEDLVEQKGKMKKYFDVFFRDKKMRRGIKLAITRGDAEELLFVEPEHGKIPAEYIKNLLENKKRIDVTDLVRIGDIDEKMFDGTSFPLPYLSRKTDTVVDYEGIAIYNGPEERMVGALKGEEAKGLSFIRGLKNNGTIDTEMDGEPFSIEIISIKRKIDLENKDPHHLKFTITVHILGAVADQSGSENLKEYKVLNKFRDKTEEKAEDMMENAVKKLQNDFQTDVMGLQEYISRHHPKIWKKVKDNWDSGENYFSKSEIKCIVNVTLQEPGSINQTITE
ncbi:Ger(x)C family spore germination protein [Ureibacillus terrenus]|uniref:Ger(x)C family spore germination protein n=1 Tax=Ureibacillus terrenus TaxID=118246 RepID=UPI002E220A04|nr:Ger(x)C family spore germination protein [Ureibacillus terrenus]